MKLLFLYYFLIIIYWKLDAVIFNFKWLFLQWSAQFFFGLYIFWLTVLCNFFLIGCDFVISCNISVSVRTENTGICLLSLVGHSSTLMKFGFIYKNIISRWMLPCRPIATASERTLSLLTHDAAFLTVHTGSPAASMILLSFLTPEDMIISRERVWNREWNVSGLQLVIVDDVGVLCFFWASLEAEARVLMRW